MPSEPSAETETFYPCYSQQCINQGDILFRRFMSLVCLTRKDTRDVTLLTATGEDTVHHTKVNGKPQILDVPVPPAVLDYNRCIGGVDKCD